MKSYFELAARRNPSMVIHISHLYYMLNKAWGSCYYYLMDSSHTDTVAKLVNDGLYVELEPTYRGDSHRYWRCYK